LSYKIFFEGGHQERRLADNYRQYAKKWVTRYMHTVGLLTKITDDCESEIKQEDKEAELMDREY
jgi:hypothetical protein